MRNTSFFLAIVIIMLFMGDLDAQITSNHLDSLGLKQGIWHEFKVPYNFVTEKIGIKIPEVTTEYYYLTKDEDRKFFPIIECIGEYENGLKEGSWSEYYGSGGIKSKIEYKGGVPFGKCKTFWGNGILKEEFTISSNDSILVLMYDHNGDLLMEKLVSKIRMIKSIYEN